MSYERVVRGMRKLADPAVARGSRRFFKCGPGEYGEGDVFWGLPAPVLRTLAKRHAWLEADDLSRLLRSNVHEQRALALLVLVAQFEKAGDAEQRRIYDFYCEHLGRVNNWDLVDLSAPAIVGGYLLRRSRKPLDALARSKDLWRRRIAIVATLRLIRQGEFGPALRIAEMLLGDREDLIHKATGWMLREVAKRDRPAVEAFLRDHYDRLPRTTLRYAIERFPEPLRRAYLRGEIPPA
jgi:3-methyladenine DNA glycosylase AlkD